MTFLPRTAQFSPTRVCLTHTRTDSAQTKPPDVTDIADTAIRSAAVVAPRVLGCRATQKDWVDAPGFRLPTATGSSLVASGSTAGPGTPWLDSSGLSAKQAYARKLL